MTNHPEHSNSEISASYGIDMSVDANSHPEWIPSTSTEEVCDAGAAYTYLEINYAEDGEVRASRNVAKILPGNRTEIAYWTEEAPTKKLTVHRGGGRLVIGDPNERTTMVVSLGDSLPQDVELPSGRFYTFEAGVGAEPLVVSGFYEPPPNWEGLELVLDPGEESVEAPEGPKQLPVEFREASDEELRVVAEEERYSWSLD